MPKKKICIVTAARSEYGLLKWLMKDIQTSSEYELQLIVTGGHLLTEQGHTIDAILADGFKPSSVVDCELDTTNDYTISSSMGRMAEKFSDAFYNLKPDLLFLLGDRYELLPICSTAFLQHIPIAHINGGDVTEGAIDDAIRNAVTMLSTYHFPGTDASAKNIERMIGSLSNIWTVGQTGLDTFNRINLMSRQELANNLGLDINRKWVLMTFHAETRNTLEYNLETVQSIIKVLKNYSDFQTVMTYANADPGGKEINKYIEGVAKENSSMFKVVPSLGQTRYLSYMKQVSFVIGNSSSGILETPFLKVPTVNIGDRQKGRYQCENIVQSGSSFEELNKSVEIALNKSRDIKDSDYWGNGHAAENIVRILKEEIYK